jgi:mannose PTS system EIIA component
MIGILLLTHGDLGEQFLCTAGMIGMQSRDYVLAVSIGPSDSPDSSREKVRRAINDVDTGDGVLVLTDLFGGTPTNISLSFLEAGRVEVVTGLNLPMLLKAMNSRTDTGLASLASTVSEAAKENIFRAGEVLGHRFRPRSVSQ